MKLPEILSCLQLQPSNQISGIPFYLYKNIFSDLTKKFFSCFFSYLLISLVIFPLLSCSPAQNPFSYKKYEKISNLFANPGKYRNKTVLIKGKVTNVFIALERGFFILSDGTGEIMVHLKKTFPRVGEEVEIKGKIIIQFVFNDATSISFIEG